MAAVKTKATGLDERVRLNLELPREVHDQLQKIQTATGAASLTEVIRRSLGLYDIVVEHTTQDGKVVFRYPDNTEEVLRLI